MKINSFITRIIIACAFIVLPSVMLAQVPGGPGPDPDTGEAVPFDGGISLLIAAGIGIGAKKAYDRKKKHQQEKQTD
jgi:hypothetical protein